MAGALFYKGKWNVEDSPHITMPGTDLNAVNQERGPEHKRRRVEREA
jgi:hypothetical protein